VTVYGHHQLNVTSIEQHQHFFVDTLGGALLSGRSGAESIVRFPNLLIFLRRQPPTGGSKGTTVNHFAFGVPNIRQMVDIVKAAGYPMVTRAEVASAKDVDDDLAYIYRSVGDLHRTDRSTG
jgi:hypothetical protein